MAKLKDLKLKKYTKLNTVDMDGFFMRQIPVKQMRELFGDVDIENLEDENNAKEVEKTFLTIIQKLVCDEHGNTFDEFENANTIEDLFDHMSLAHVKSLTQAIMTEFHNLNSLKTSMGNS